MQSTARDAACSALSNNRLFPCILNIIEQHSTDESAIVRKRLAAGLHEIAVLLEMDAYRYVRVAWNRLLLDEDLDVFTTLIRSADTILCCFTRDQRWNPLDADFNQMLVMILRKHNQLVRENKKYKWRQIADVIGQFRNFCIYFGMTKCLTRV